MLPVHTRGISEALGVLGRNDGREEGNFSQESTPNPKISVFTSFLP
jgi:hypothetical protein